MDQNKEHKNNDFYIIVPGWLMRAKRVRLSAKFVLRYLAYKTMNNVNSNNPEWAKLWFTQISNDIGIPKRTLQRDLNQLRAMGYITTKQEKHHNKLTGHFTIDTWYKVNVPLFRNESPGDYLAVLSLKKERVAVKDNANTKN